MSEASASVGLLLTTALYRLSLKLTKKAPNISISTPFSKFQLSLQELTPKFYLYEKQKL